MYLPLSLHCWHVWCYVHRSIQHLFTRQMFLSALFNDIISLAPPQIRHYCLCLTTQVHACVPFLEALHYAQPYITLPAEIQRGICLLLQRKHSTPALFFFLSKSSAPNVWLPVDWAGRQLDLVCPVKGHWLSHSFLRMDNQFANEIFAEIFVRHFAATWLVYKKCVQNVHVCKVEKSFLVHFHVLRAIP